MQTSHYTVYTLSMQIYVHVAGHLSDYRLPNLPMLQTSHPNVYCTTWLQKIFNSLCAAQCDHARHFLSDCLWQKSVRLAEIHSGHVFQCLSMLQNSFQQHLELERDAALHKQQLEMDRQKHALQLAQEARTTAQTDAERLKIKHAQELELSEV